jgi:acyl-CoA reductase-like NAD-dependent aldehyde dehydrogenase
MTALNHDTPAARYQNWYGGNSHPAISGEEFETINPTTGGIFGRFANSDGRDVDAAVTAAAQAFEMWRALSPTERGRLLRAWGDKLADAAERIGTIETLQNGKLLAEQRVQGRGARDWLHYFAGLADKVEGAVIPVPRRSVLNYTLKEPLGVIGVIKPWNSPLSLTIQTVAPALAAGNTVVIKPSEITPASAIEMARLAEEAGIPPGVVNVVTGARAAGDALVKHPKISKLSFTGSVATGRAIAEQCGHRLISCVLELGGKSPNIVFADANLEAAEAGVLAGIFAAAGQSCVAGSRAYVHRKVYDRFVASLVKRASKLVIGDPLHQATQMGPISNRAQLEKNLSMVQAGVSGGAEILYGGQRILHADFPNGLFFQPTIMHKASGTNPIMCQEVFGPVLAVTPFDDDDEVLRMANDSEFGLAAGVWTRDFARAHLMANRLQSGTVWINTYRAITFNSPFGGYKASGLGRQGGIDAIDQYLQVKSVWCETSSEIQDPFVIKTV